MTSCCRRFAVASSGLRSPGRVVRMRSSGAPSRHPGWAAPASRGEVGCLFVEPDVELDFGAGASDGRRAARGIRIALLPRRREREVALEELDDRRRALFDGDLGEAAV